MEILWMDRIVPTNVDLISSIIGYPWMGRTHNNTWKIKLRQMPSPMKSRQSMEWIEEIGESRSAKSTIL
jgi:hypothetical protein